ncbi:OmpA family protein [Chachezhania antarctica]|uniref:OmpA family protein n=1 Tax=Chachezhania antarctica TaxID=2340860 RepID=UPI000EAE9461|nr:OmpA family protein [Chachezhania antarctica]
MRCARAVYLVLLSAALPAVPAAAFAPPLPADARVLSDETRENEGYALPTGPYRDGDVPVELFPGKVTRQSWQLVQSRATPAQILDPIRAQLQAEGFTVVYECAAQACGGFDFRFQTDVLPAPDMYVDLRNFRFLSAKKGETHAVSVLVSRSRTAAYVQVITAIAATVGESTVPTPVDAEDAAAGTPMPIPLPTPVDGSVADLLLGNGYIVLDDLDFAEGSSSLGEGPHPSLAALAAFLKAHEDARIALVGHTDTVGSQSANVRLSQQRARSARDRLVQDHGVNPGQLSAHGTGYLSPRTSNRTPEGREANRRVEAVLTVFPEE